MLNIVVLIGRLTRDPELKYTQNGVAYATFTLAVDRMRKSVDGQKETDFIPVVIWQKGAENCANYIGKGSLISVSGRIHVRTYDDKDGKRHWVTEVVADSVRFLETRSKRSEQEPPGREIAFDPEDMPF